MMSVLNVLKEIVTWVGAHAMPAVTAFVVFLLAYIAAGLVRRAMVAAFEKSHFDATLAKFFSNLARYAILLTATLGVLGIFGVETTSFAAVIGAASLAVGLAFQGTLSNFAAGVMLLIFRPFKVDDTIEIGTTLGKVVEIELFTTELVTPQRVKIIVPNNSLFGAVIKNYSHHPARRVDVAIGVDYGADIDKTREILEAAIANIEGALAEPPPEVSLNDLTATSVAWTVQVFATNENFGAVRQRVVRACKVALDENGIEFPVAKMQVQLDRGEAAE